MRPTLPLAVCVVLGCLGSAPAAEPNKDVKALRDAVVKAETAGSKAKAYRALFEKVGKAGLPDLMKDDDTGLALQAAWEVHQKMKKAVTDEEKKKGDVLDPEEMKKFVAFLAKRTKAPVPEWWAENISDGGTFLLDEGRGRPKFRKSKSGVYVAERAELEEAKETFVYTVGKRSIEFPKDTFENALSWRCEYTGIVGEKRSVIVQLNDDSGFTLAGFEGKGGKAKWKVEGWGVGGPLARTGIHPYWADVVEKDGNLYVFETGCHGMSLQAFDVATGKCAFRFCTEYWYQDRGNWSIK